MTVTVIYPPDPYTIFEPRPVRTYTIDETLPIAPIPERGTENPYYESYWFWINPENRITHEDITALYQYQLGEDFDHPTRSESLSERWYTKSHSSQDTDYEVPSVWKGNKR